MAKATCLQVLNKVEQNLGEVLTTSGTLASISGLSLLIFNTMNEVLYEIANEYKLQPNEVDVSLTMVANQGTYTGTQSIVDFDKDSFIYNNQKPIPYWTPQRVDRKYPIRTSTGVPNFVYYWGGYFRPYPVPAASEAGKTLTFRAWRVPSLYSTATATGTSYIPEGFDLTLLANWVTYKVLSYKQNPEAQVYYFKVFGSGDRRMEGQLDNFKRVYGSPQILDGNIMVEPMENGGINGIVQPPITA